MSHTTTVAEQNNIVKLFKQYRMFESINPKWKKSISKNKIELHKALCGVFMSTKFEDITPPPKDIFNSLIIDPDDIKVIIMGQDPYPLKGDANGYAFSTNAKNIPASLRNIFSCLNRLEYTTESSNLFSWTLNGVMLLNMSLTTKIGCKRSHSEYWYPFICNLISNITSRNKNIIHILLWGNDAQKVESYIKGKHNILKWSHPSPMADCQLEESKKFINCTNFDSILDIEWSTGDAFILYTDGGWSDVHNSASFAIYWENVLELSGLVKPYIYSFETERIIADNNTDINPTSQRGEYLAICYCLWIVYYLNLRNVIIVSDSRNAIGIITEWTKKKESNYKNSDLVKIMRELYDLVKNHTKIIHVHSHSKTKSPHNEGNEIANKLATNSTSSSDYSIKINYLKTRLYLPI